MIELKKIDINSRADEWNEYISHSISSGTKSYFIGHNPSLASIFNMTFGYNNEYYILEDNGKIVGLLPGFRINGKFTSIPLFPLAGLFVRDDTIKQLIYSNILSSLKSFEIRDIINFTNYSYKNKVVSYLNLENNSDDQIHQIFFR